MVNMLKKQKNIIKVEDPRQIASLYQDWQETMIYSYLDGYKGSAYASCAIAPTSAMILIGDFCFFAGVPNIHLIKNIHQDFCILSYDNQEWEKLIEGYYQTKVSKHQRYALLKEKEVFDLQLLENNVQRLSGQYSLQKINKHIYQQLWKEGWSCDLCSCFDSYEEYQQYGLGYVICKDDLIVSGASSYTYYRDGIEIEIDTHPHYRRQGLARVAASQLILTCLQQNKYPSWDAHNQQSLALAMSLGYHFDCAYPVYVLKK